MPRPSILLLGPIDHAHSAWQSLSTHADLLTPESSDRASFIAECHSGRFDNVLAAYRTFPSISITGRFDAELLSHLPPSWKYLAHCGAGYDQIDVVACQEREPVLLVSNVPDPVNDATADTAVFLLLGALRNFGGSMAALRRGEWRGDPAPMLGRDPQGKVLGILGMGGIGRNLMRKCEVFGMTTIYHNRRRLDEEKAGGAEYVSFEELLEGSDVLSLNLPLNQNTRHIIGWQEMKRMKRTAVIVNTARGAVMDEKALVRALDEGVIAGAGLDVYEDEPKIDEGLVKNERLLLLPHMGTWSMETQTKMEEWAIDNVRCVLDTGRLKSVVPELEEAQEKLYGKGK